MNGAEKWSKEEKNLPKILSKKEDGVPDSPTPVKSTT